MIINRYIALPFFIIFSNSVVATESEFPGIGFLYVAGLEDCSKDRTIDFVPEVSTQYFLTRTEFSKLIVGGSSITITKLKYPTVPWIDVMNNLPDEPEGCGFGLAIQSKDLKVAKLGMERFKITSGRIIKHGEIYYWGE